MLERSIKEGRTLKEFEDLRERLLKKNLRENEMIEKKKDRSRWKLE
jgi:hypothetical protein